MELRCKLHYDITGNAKSEIFIDELERFMAERRYTFKRPTDISVYQSKYVLGKGRYYDLKLPFRIKCFLILYAKTPDYLRKMLPDRMKEFFTNLV